MRVDGDEAKGFSVVRLDSLEQVPGTLVSADEQSGTVVTADKTGSTKTFELGPRNIRIIRKYTYGR